MVTSWIASYVRLPEVGERIEFVLCDRDVALQGEYHTSGFCSHWSTYGLVRVLGWRSLGKSGDVVMPASAQNSHGAPGGGLPIVRGAPLHSAG